MFLIWFVNGMIRIPLFLLALILLLPVAFLFVVVTSPVRIFKKGLHESFW